MNDEDESYGGSAASYGGGGDGAGTSYGGGEESLGVGGGGGVTTWGPTETWGPGSEDPSPLTGGHFGWGSQGGGGSGAPMPSGFWAKETRATEDLMNWAGWDPWEDSGIGIGRKTESFWGSLKGFIPGVSEARLAKAVGKGLVTGQRLSPSNERGLINAALGIVPGPMMAFRSVVGWGLERAEAQWPGFMEAHVQPPSYDPDSGGGGGGGLPVQAPARPAGAGGSSSEQSLEAAAAEAFLRAWLQSRGWF